MLWSWTSFNKNSTNVTTLKSSIHYMLRVLVPVDFQLCKEYQDFVTNIFNILEIVYGFNRVFIYTLFSFVSFDTATKGFIYKCYVNIEKVLSCKTYAGNSTQTSLVLGLQRLICRFRYYCTGIKVCRNTLLSFSALT